MLRFALKLVIVFVFLASDSVAEDKSHKYDLESQIFGTGLSVDIHLGKTAADDPWMELETGYEFSNGWDKRVVEKATSWANIAGPNIHIRITSPKEGVWIIDGIYSAADPWSKGGTPMHKVAEDYLWSRVSSKNLNRLLADMRTAYHEHFRNEPMKNR